LVRESWQQVGQECLDDPEDHRTNYWTENGCRSTEQQRGPVIGAVIFWVIQAFLSNLLPALSLSGVLPVSTTQASTLRFVLVGIGLMLLVIYRPQGIFGDKRELTFVR